MPSVAELRVAVAELVRLAETDLAVVWRDVSDGEMGRDVLMIVLPDLVATYGSAAATLTADWYDDTRDDAIGDTRFRAITAELPDAGRTESLARWAVGPMFYPEPDPGSALTLAQGGLQRIVADASRYTVAGSAVADPAARGWRRVGTGRNCEFCNMLISRGAVYTESSAEFKSHDHCNCAAAPVFE
jgi:hypothetical protein